MHLQLAPPTGGQSRFTRHRAYCGGFRPPALRSRSRDEGGRRRYIIGNGRIVPRWEPMNDDVLAVTQRRLSTLIKGHGIGDLYHIYSTAKVDGIDFNLASIPTDFDGKTDAPSDLKYMRALDRGYEWAIAASVGRKIRWGNRPPTSLPRRNGSSETCRRRTRRQCRRRRRSRGLDRMRQAFTRRERRRFRHRGRQAARLAHSLSRSGRP
jgi:hypothetical protein